MCSATPHRAKHFLPEAAPVRTRSVSGPLSYPDKEQAKKTEEMNNTYCPIDPVTTLAFQQVLKDHSDCALEILLMSYAVQNVVGDAVDRFGPSRFELSKHELEVALGCGVEAAAKCAKMSGLKRAETGDWVAKEGQTRRFLKVKSDLLAKFTHSIADAI